MNNNEVNRVMISWALPPTACTCVHTASSSAACLRLRDTPRPLTSKLKWLPEKNTRSIALVGLAEYSAAYPVRAKTALQQKRWLDALL